MNGYASYLPAGFRSVARRLLRGRADPAAQQYRGAFRGYVDGLNEAGAIRGWVVRRENLQGRVMVGLYAGDVLLDAGIADMIREDVRTAIGADPHCGFEFPLTDAFYQKIAGTDGHITVRTEGKDSAELGRLHLEVDQSNPRIEGNDVAHCRHVLKAEIAALQKLLVRTTVSDAPLPALDRPALARHGLLFSTERIVPEIPESGQSAYLDYTRYRTRLDQRFPVAPEGQSQDRFLYWYLCYYRHGSGLRVPMSRQTIDYLNTPISMADKAFTLSRVIWWRLVNRPDVLGTLDLNNHDCYTKILYWWVFQDAPQLGHEDCLVPDRFADYLRIVHPVRRLDAWPLSYFSERYFLDNPKLHFLAPGTAEGRKVLALIILLHAASRPDLLRYMPREILNRLLAPNPENPRGASDFEVFFNALLAGPRSVAESEAEDEPQEASPAYIPISRDRYAAMLRLGYFDLDSFSFMTRDSEGNRFEAAALPLPDPMREKVDVQLIGPLAKASGLGQATRLSADILRATGLRMRGVDFDLDNPSPEGFSSDTMIEDYGPAKINLIHLNSESIPLAFAYQPDVFSGAYNIGYFFWELDRPAYCHYLGMEMLDEIWVSTEYGVEIYKPDAKGKPVVNVGMCYEDMGDLSRREARDFINRRMRFNDSLYVCLVAFDSFSFVQRKNPMAVLRAFQKAFEGVPEVRLIVKTQNRDSVLDPVQIQLWEQVDQIIASDHRIVVLNETLSYRDLLRLKAGSDCYISLHKSEGWGFGMIEAMNLKVPVVCTAYSGNMDFCSEETAWLVGYEESLLQQDDYIFVRKGSVWAEPRVDEAALQLRAAYDNPEERKARAEAAYAHIRKDFSVQAIARRYGDRLRTILAGLS